MARFRRLLILLTFLLAPLLSHAATPAPPIYSTRGEAYSVCKADSAKYKAYLGGLGYYNFRGNDCTWIEATRQQSGVTTIGEYMCNLTATHDQKGQFTATCSQYGGGTNPGPFYYAMTTCGPNTTWDPNQNKCASQCAGGYGTDPLTGQCMDQDKCLARNSGIYKGPRLSATPFPQCYDLGGCAFSPSGSVDTVDGPGMARYRATLTYSGASPSTCSAVTDVPQDLKPDAPKKEEECMPAGSGQTYCVKADGQQCASASNGKKFCWKPGETGTKTDGPDLQKRDAGETHIPPNLQLPNGDNLVKKGETIKTSTTTTNVTNNTSTTVTTNVTSYGTANGTNASGGTDGKQAEGSGGGGGDEEGDENGASGGGDCKAPPIVTGDAALGMVATQAWATRCAVEAGNAAKVSGDIGDCKSAFSVEGDNANAIKLRAMRAQICGEPEWAKPKDGEGSTDNPTAGEGEGMGDGLLKLDFKIGDAFDHSGFFGGGSPPSLGVLDFGFFGTFDMDSEPWFPDLIALCRGFLILLAIFLAIQIILKV